jgi:predicted O-linked N-acetylglucosamine transferase (SPINDLY family)
MIHCNPRFDAQAIYAEHIKWNNTFAQPLTHKAAPHANSRDETRKLKIGYVSPDFRSHCQSLFTISVFSNHDHQQFEIFCYSTVKHPDEVTQYLKRFADHWLDASNLDDDALARQIRNDKIDILIDLTMHMSEGRPLLFARKPAPVQAAWLAYPSTTGLSAMDYRLTDPYLEVASCQLLVASEDKNPNLLATSNQQLATIPHYSETSILLPHTFWCYDPQSDTPAPSDLPALTNGHITFGCLNNFCKVTDPTLSLWRKVLAANPTSRMILMAPPGGHRKIILEKLNVNENRIDFVIYRPRSQYLLTYHRIDLCLDTFPYNGHTTSLDGLWLGVPTISLIGQTAVSRAGFSQASNLGLADEFVAKDETQFVKLATTLANNLPRLSELRQTLRQRMKLSPLMDAPKFCRDVETAYQWMWQQWCRPPSPS